MTSEIHKFIKCECGAHALEITIEKEEKVDDSFVYIALWSYGDMGDRRNFWQRFKIAWKYLMKNKLHSDHVVLNSDNVKELNSFIENNFYRKNKSSI
jgi:hypothetical protein